MLVGGLGVGVGAALIPGRPGAARGALDSFLFGPGLLGLALVLLWLGQSWLRRRQAESKLIAHQAVLERALRHESLVSEIAARLNASDDFHSSLDEVLITLSDRLRIDRVAVYSLQEDSAARISSRISRRGVGIQEAEALPLQELKSSVLRAATTAQSLASEDLSAFPAEERRFYRGRGIEALVVVPVQVAGRAKGILSFAQRRRYPWSADEISLLETLAELLATTWERYEEMTSRLQAEAKQAETLQALEKQLRVAAVGVMAAGLAHEINQPLNAIRVAVDSALRRGGATDEKRWVQTTTRRLATVREAAARIDEIIRHMREFWGDQRSRTLEVVDLREAVDRCFELLRHQAQRQRVQLRFDRPDDPVWVRASLIQLEQIVINLVNNAIQAFDDGSAGRKVQVHVSAEDTAASLRVCDSGPGVDPAHVAKLFDPDFSTKQPGYGTGLGLAIVKNIAGSFEGRVECSQAQLGGARFTLSLPRHPGDKGRP